ncbi:MAG: hypothetical protein LBF16_04300 [Pseudomonadales bacterium]|jgi:tetrahydromethanopterin S-methyltransferase subunit G|nr:hypothetical protein [Pseudomonadales bacterium]
MTDENIENLLLEHMQRFQAGQERIERTLKEHTQRLGRIELAIARTSSNQSHQETDYAEQSVRLDQLAERLDRIERRLELRES